MLIDCESCAAKPAACTDCVVTVLLGLPGAEPDLDATEQRAIDALADGGLIPPLRLVPIGPPRITVSSDSFASGHVSSGHVSSNNAEQARPAAHADRARVDPTAARTGQVRRPGAAAAG